MKRTTALAIVILALALTVFASLALVASSDNTPTTEAATTTAALTSTTSAAPTTAAPTTTTTIVDPENTRTDEVSGNLLVEDIPPWDPVFYEGELVRDSWLCNAEVSETSALSWLGMFVDGNGRLTDAEGLNASNNTSKVKFWNDYPSAAKNMLEAIQTEKPWLIQVFRLSLGNRWDGMNDSEKMALIESVTWTQSVQRATSFRTTRCNNDVESVTDEDFREVRSGGNITTGPTDDEVGRRFVDVFLPGLLKDYLKGLGLETRIQQVVDSEGQMFIDVVNGNDVTRVAITTSVPVYVTDNLGENVAAEALFSTVCGNLVLPEYQPPYKAPPPEETTTTTAGTTTTVPGTTTTHGTTTTSSSTTTTHGTTTTSTTHGTTTTSTTHGTTTTSSSTTTTTHPPTTTTTTTLPESFNFRASLVCDISGDFAKYVLMIDITDDAPGAWFNHQSGDSWSAAVVGTHGYSVTVTATWPNSGGSSPLSRTAAYTGDCGKSATTTTVTTVPGATTSSTIPSGIPTTTLPH